MADQATVYFVPTPDVDDEGQGLTALDALWEKAGFDARLPAAGSMAIKMHFGDQGNHRTVPPAYVRRLGERVARAGARPFATDTTTLYSGARSEAVSHLMLAAEHGYTTEALGMPVIIADGMRGEDQVRVSVHGKHFAQCSLASAWQSTQGFILLTHLTGHCVVGFGGALKNAAMGWASRGGKRMQHSATRPEIQVEKCTACGTCVARCPVSALSLAPGQKIPTVDKGACIGCGQCFSVCPTEAVQSDWGSAGAVLQEKVAEYACAAVQAKQPHVICVTFLTRITRQCDCMGNDHDFRLADLGIAASTDIVALDAACRDLCNRSFGGDFFSDLWPEIDPGVQVSHAESLGLGTQDYALVEVTA